MSRKVFVNLPVMDLARTKAFFADLGFTFNAQFTDDSAACMVIGEANYAMLITHDRFRDFTPKAISDASKSTEVLVCLTCDSREDVDALMTRALAAGGSEVRDPDDHGVMYGRSFNDLDGHIWELFWMDPAAIQPTA